MDRKLTFFVVLTAGCLGWLWPSLALQKAQLGSTIKMTAVYYLPIFAAEEKGFWKDNGLQVEWVPFANPPAFFRAAVAGHIQVGYAMTDSSLIAIDRGVPGFMVAELVPSFPLHVWVRTDSPFKRVEDLKGARIGLTALWDPPHVYGKIIAKTHGIDKDIRFVGAGGIPEMLAGLRTGAFEATLNSLAVSVPLKLGGVIRELATNVDYLPKPWVDVIVFARKDFAKNKPDMLRGMLKATVQASNFIRNNQTWAMERMKSFQGISDKAAELVYQTYPFTIAGRLAPEAIENMRSVLMEYGILSKKMPATKDLFTNDYLP